MKHHFTLIAATALILLSSCHSPEQVLYFQDLQSGESLPTRTLEALKLQPGDKVSIVVSSALTPKLAEAYNIAVAQRQVGTASSNSNSVGIYVIDENGNVDIPALGRVHIAGLTRSEAAQRVQDMLRNGKINDAVVTINAYDQYVTIMGEVARPGRIKIDHDNITLLEALGAAGDLTIQARRDRVLVMRQEGNETQTFYVDLRTKDALNSPVYNLRQNDIVYVEPNKVRMSQSTYNENSFRQVGTWLSITSVIISLGILIFR